MNSARHSAIRLLQLMMVASVVLPAVLFVFASWLSYRHERSVADDRIERSLDIVHEHALKVFQTGERAIAEVEEVIRGMPDGAIAADQQRLSERLKRIVDAVQQFQAIIVVDRTGKVLVSTSVPTPSAAANVADRRYFQLHAAGAEGTLVSEPLVPRWGAGLRNPFFTLTRRRESPDGAFAGVVSVAILPRYFEEFYALIGRSPSDLHALVRSDGTFLARHPSRGDDARPLDPSSALRIAIAVGKERALYTVPRSQSDSLERRIGFRKLTGFPVYVVAGIEASAIRAEWLSTMSGHLIFGLPATLLLFVIIGVALQRTRKLHAEADRREAAEDALRQAQHLRAIGQLTGGVAHDFNNLLMIISGSVQRLRRDLSEAKHTRLLDMITNATSRGESLTRQLLAFSRRQTLTPAVIDLCERLPELRDMLNRSLRGDITITVVVPHKRCAVKVDPSELELALLNLAVNARDAMPQGGALGITAKAVVLKGKAVEEGLAGEFVAIRVADTGSGIPPDALPHVFEPFFTTKEVGKGTGLGLSQVYGFAKQSGGTATVTSTVGRGTVITLYLPRTHEHPAPSMADAEPESVPEPAGTVLLVEDNAEVAEVASAYFEQLGYRVRAVTSAQAALQSLDADPKVDLVFSDILMPGGMNGLELGHAIVARYPGLPVLLASGYSNSARDAVAQGFVVLQKPFDLAALERGLRDARRSKLEAKTAAEPTSEPKEDALG
jgi:two-component system NtrC family sensor kinase